MIKLCLRLLLLTAATSSTSLFAATYVGVSNDILTASLEDLRSEKGPQMFAGLQAICASALSKEACDAVSQAHLCQWHEWRKVNNPNLGYFNLRTFKWQKGAVDYVRDPHCQIELTPRAMADGTFVKGALGVAGLLVGALFAANVVGDLNLPISRIKSALFMTVVWGVTAQFWYIPVLKEGHLLTSLKENAIEAWTIGSSAKPKP